MSARFAAYSLLLGNFVVGACVTAPAGMLNELAVGLNATVVEIGLLVTAGAVVLCFGSPITASLTSRLDRRTLLAGSALIMALTNLASAVAPNYWVLLIVRLIMLVGAAPFTPQAAGTIAMIVPEKERASAISFIFIGWSLSLALGLPVMGFLADNIGWRAGYAALGGAALVATAFLYFGVPSGLRGAAMSLKSWGEIARNRRILLILSVTAIQVSGQFAIFTYLAPLITRHAGGTVGTVAIFFAAFGIAGLIGNIIASRIVGGLGALRTSIVFLASTLLGCIVWAAGFGWIPAMFAAALLLGLGFAAINSMQQARLVAAAPPLASGSVALNTSCIYIGQAVGSGFGGLLFDAGQIGLLNFAAVVFVLAGLAVLLTTRGPGEKLFRQGERDMADAVRVLVAGESWMTHSVHVKGFDSFETTSYHEGGTEMLAALRAGGAAVTYQPAHVAADHFPSTAEALRDFDVVILSDIGANTLLLPQRTFLRSEASPNRLQLLKGFVEGGGGLLMIGGYLTFQGIQAKGNYRGSPVEAVLPVRLHDGDDRSERPEGILPTIVEAGHPVMAGLTEWPQFLGYNRSTLREDAKLLATVDGDPFIAVRTFGKGRSAIFASDCGPHWGPPSFLAWHGYQRLWGNLAGWLAGR